MTENQWNAETVAPSGRYGFVRPKPTKWDGNLPVVQVVQLVDGRWGPTPARYVAEQLVDRARGPLAIDMGAQWILSTEDADALSEFAATVLVDSYLGR